MKAIITFTLLLIITGAQALPIHTDSTNPGKKSEISNPSNPSIITMEQLQEENNQLKAKLVRLENKFEDDRSLYNYQLSMIHMVTKLDDGKKFEQLEDLKAQLSFNHIMTNALLFIKNETVAK